MKRCVLLILLAGLVALICPYTTEGQGTDLGTVRGVVRDAGGAVIPDAAVVVSDNLTGHSRQIRSNSSGEWQLFGISSGSYTVEISSPGMATRRITGVVVRGSAVVSVDTTLTASTTATVDVDAETAPLINVDDQTISQTIDSKAIAELPRDSRDIYSFLYLNPSVTQADASGNFKFLGAQSYGASFSVDGQRSNGGIFGQPTQSQPSLEAVGDLNVLTNDFTAEYAGVANVRVTTKRGGEKYHGSVFYNNKNSSLAAWQLQDKAAAAAYVPLFSGDTYRKPYFNYNDLGASFGGRVPKVKSTFFFASYERNYAITPTPLQSTKLPHPSTYTGDFSTLKPSALPNVPSNITLTASEIATDTYMGLGKQFLHIPSRLLNPSTQTIIQKYFPHLSTGVPINASNGTVGALYYANMKTPSTTDRGTMRLDHSFGNSDQIYGVYNVSAQTNLSGSPLASPYIGFGQPVQERMNHTVSLSYTHTFSSNIVNEARGGFNRQHLYQHEQQTMKQFLSGIGFSGSDINTYGSVVGAGELDTYGHMGISFSGSGVKTANIGTGGRNTDRPMDQNLLTFGDTLTWVLGRHSLRIGGDIVRNAFIDGFAVNRGNVRGLLTYKGIGNYAQAGQTAKTTDPFANFLLGEGGTTFGAVISARPPMAAHNWEQGYFIQDAWKVTPNFTINAGLRWDIFSPFVENNDLLANFDPNGRNAAGNRGVFIIPSDKTLKYLDPRIVSYGYITANTAGLGRGLVKSDFSNFGPRIGLAWKINNHEVLRGGYGMFYPTSAAQLIRDPIGTNPFNQPIAYTSRPGNLLQAWPGFAGAGGGGNPAVGGTPSVLAQNALGTNMVDINIKNPRVHQYNVTFEHQFRNEIALRGSYIGSYQTGLIAGSDMNMIPPNDTPFGTTTGDGITACDPENTGDCDYSPADRARQPFPGLTDYLYNYHNYGHALSNALQIQTERQFHSGFGFMLAYTYLDQKSTALDTGNSSLGGAAYNIFAPESDYSEDSYISHHRVVGYGVFDLPYGRGHKWAGNAPRFLDALIGGWQGTFNFFAKSGTFFTPYWVCDDCGPLTPGNLASGASDAVGDFNATPSYRPIALNNNYNHHIPGAHFDASAFGLNSTGPDLFSTGVKRNILQGPGTWGVNLGVHKTFAVNDRINLQLGADIDNLFNHPMLSPSADGASNTSFTQLGDYSLAVDPVTLKPYIDPSSITYNDVAGATAQGGTGTFGVLNSSYQQEGVDSRRSIRIRARLTF